MRIKTSTATKKRHNKLISSVKGYRGNRKHSIKLARQAALKAGVYSYRDRRNKKRDLRSRFILRINAALTDSNINYSSFINSLKKHNIILDRKVMSRLAIDNPKVFHSIVDATK